MVFLCSSMALVPARRAFNSYEGFPRFRSGFQDEMRCSGTDPLFFLERQACSKGATLPHCLTYTWTEGVSIFDSIIVWILEVMV